MRRILCIAAALSTAFGAGAGEADESPGRNRMEAGRDAEGQAPPKARPALTGVAEGQAPRKVRPALTRQRYFFTAEIAENAENGELLWPLLSGLPDVVLPFP
ncbi:MAG: hypothetical protein ACYTFI_04715, partial [Planctomycetota bacterium]